MTAYPPSPERDTCTAADGYCDNLASGKHILVLGPVRRGVSSIDMQPISEAALDKLKDQELADEDQEDERITAVRNAFWNASPEGVATLEELLWTVMDKPTLAQQKNVFFMLPVHILGQGIAWGFSDSVVRDEILEYLQDNLDEIIAEMREA